MNKIQQLVGLVLFALLAVTAHAQSVTFKRIDGVTDSFTTPEVNELLTTGVVFAGRCLT